MSSRRHLAALALPILVLAGCSGGEDSPSAAAAGAGADSEDTAVAAAEGSAGACAAWDGELVSADAAPGEPTIEVPAPAGWDRNTMMDSELVRLALINQGLTREAFAPNVVVTAEPGPADAEAAVEAQLAGISNATGSELLPADRGETCGHPSATVGYELPAMGAVPARPATVKLIVVPRGSESVTFTITAQATAPSDPAYDRDVAAMLDGVQITDAPST